ncbi:hypothetical protein RHS03_07418, partial [Rhizoctonia solani]
MPLFKLYCFLSRIAGSLETYASVAVDDVWAPYAVQEGEPVAARRQPRDTHHSEIAVLNGVWPTSTCSLNLPGSPIEHAASFSHPDTEFITPYLVHPAVPNNPWPDQLVVDGKSPGNSKKAAAKIIKDEIEIAEANADGNSIHSYSDAHAGTLHSIPKVGLGYTVKYGRKTLANGSTSIGPRANIYDAEIHPAQYASRIFHRHAHTFLSGHPNRHILVKWLPGHSNIQGNEQADEAAKGTNASKRASRSWKKIWDEHTASRPDSSAYIPRAPSFKLHPIFNNTTLSRNVQCRLVQFLTGHGLYGEYRARFRPHLNSQCSCGETEQTPRHSLLFCPDTAEFRHILTSASPNRTGKELFGTLPGLEAVADFISKSGIRKLGDPPATAQNMQDLTSTFIRP